MVLMLLASPFGPSLISFLLSTVIVAVWLAPLPCSVTGILTVTDCPALMAGTATGLVSLPGWNTPTSSDVPAFTVPWLRITTLTVKVWLAVGVPGLSVTESITRSATGPVVLVGAAAGGLVGGAALGTGVGGEATTGTFVVSPTT